MNKHLEIQYKKEETVLSLREIWRWILNYTENDTLFEIYKEVKINFAGFRALKSPNDLTGNIINIAIISRNEANMY